MDSTMKTVYNSPDESNEMSFYDNSPDSGPKPCSIGVYTGMSLAEDSSSNSMRTNNIGIEHKESYGFIRDFNTLDLGHYGATNDSDRHSKFEAAPNRMETDSPKASIMTPRSCFRPLDSICDSLDDSNDGCMELLDMESNINILNALDKDNSSLIGDFSKPLSLPVISGKHTDLKSISADTMAKLLRGDFKRTVASYCIIDCRYPYEYNSGHIQGAENVYTHDEIMNVFLKNKTVVLDEPKRSIVIFHCEFSSERAPKLLRFLRSKDRELNNNTYPALHYPEIYLLHEGYKEFFNCYSDLCDPKAYLPMLAPSHTSDYRYFRDIKKTCNGGKVARSSKLGKSRSRLFL